MFSYDVVVEFYIGAMRIVKVSHGRTEHPTLKAHTFLSKISPKSEHKCSGSAGVRRQEICSMVWLSSEIKLSHQQLTERPRAHLLKRLK